MIKCPKCRNYYLHQHIIYRDGSSDTYYKCLCGYDSRNNEIYLSDRTDYPQTTGTPPFSNTFLINTAGPLNYYTDNVTTDGRR